MPAAIDIIDLRKTYGQREVLHGLTLQVARGEVFGFLGPNGAGKSTTMKILAGPYGPAAEMPAYSVKTPRNPMLASAWATFPSSFDFTAGSPGSRCCSSTVGWPDSMPNACVSGFPLFWAR